MIDNVKIAYAHDATSVYDSLFLEYLSKNYTTFLLTFNSNPRFISFGTIAVIMREPFDAFLSRVNLIEALRMYILWPLRVLCMRLELNRINPRLLFGCFGTKYGFYSALSRFKPFVLMVWGSDVLVAPGNFFLSKFMVKLALEKADAVIVDSEVQRKAAIQLGCASSKICKFPWFDLNSVRVKNSREEVRKKLNWLHNPIVINIRRHDPICGVEYFIEALPQVIRAVPESRFLLLGKGELSESLKKRTKELKIEKYVRFLGQVPREEVFDYLNAADLYVSTSLSDGTSASLLEAMSLKIPSLVTQIPGNQEWIKDTYNGYLIPVRDSDRLAEKIIMLLTNEKLRKNIGENALQTVRQNVDWARSAQSLSDLISKLVGR